VTAETLWCELAWLGEEEPTAGVLLELQDERIASVTPGVAPPAGTEALLGLTLPGLANAHSHAFHRALRGRTQRATGGSFWTWRVQMYALAESLDEASTEALARATFAEMVLAGITLVGEFDYLHHSGAIIRAAHDAGIRLTLIDACYLHGGLPQFRDPSAEAWADRVAQLSPGPTVRLGAAIHSVRAVWPREAALVAGFAADRAWPLHAHVSEQPDENRDSIARHGATPLQMLHRAGAISDRFTAVHATHLAPGETRLLGGSGACVCMCPTTERDLADGIGSARELADVGATLALGSDSHAVIDMFEEARAMELDERLHSRIRGHFTPVELATAATGGGYACLGWPEGGRIAPGALADLVTVSLGGRRLAGTRPQDALDAVLYGAASGDVNTVIVGGRRIVRDGAHVSIDVPGALQAAIAPV
jgi:formiminoglutamate deiminase